MLSRLRKRSPQLFDLNSMIGQFDQIEQLALLLVEEPKKEESPVNIARDKADDRLDCRRPDHSSA
jgi:hypothetical protein